MDSAACICVVFFVELTWLCTRDVSRKGER